MDLRRYSVVGALLFCVAALAVPNAASAAGGKKGKAKTEAKAESDERASDSSSDEASEGDDAEGAAEPAEEEYVEPDAWERPPVEEEEAPPAAAPAKPKDEPHGDGRHVGIGLLIGYGFEHGNTFGSNPYSLGFGLRGGYTLDFGLYVGGMFTYFLGTTTEGNTGVVAAGPNITQSSNYIEFLAEVGYDLWISKVVIRPYIGLGMGVATLDTTAASAGLSSPVNSFAFAPGASIFYNINSVFLGGDLRFNLMGGNGVDGTVISLLGGMRF